MAQLPFDLHALRAFVAVCEGSSMAEAAHKLNVTQSAISQLIKGLEKQCGLTLFDREFRPLRPTAQGLLLLELAKDLLGHAQSVAERLTLRTRQVQIRLGGVDSFSGACGAALVRALLGRAREISLWSGLTPMLSQQLGNRELDLAICTEAPMTNSRIVQEYLFMEKFVAVVARGTLKSSRAPFEQLKSMPLMRYSRRSIIGQQVERYLRHIGLSPVQRFEFDITDPLLEMVCHGEGFGVTTPLCLWQSRHFLDRLEVVPLPDSPLRSRSFYLLRRQDEWLSFAHEVAEVTRGIVITDTLKQLRERLPSIPHDAILT